MTPTGKLAPESRGLTVGGFALGLAAIGLVGFVDLETGAHVGLAAIYLIPVLAGGYLAGAWTGLLLAMIAALVWLAADLIASNGARVGVSIWNGVGRLAIFIVVAGLVASWRRKRERLDRANRELEVLLARERDLARTDWLTGLPNSRAFAGLLAAVCARAERSHEPWCLAYIDLDDFKLVNDRDGHAAGDACLREVAVAIREVIRAGDIPARLGGDEFVVLLPGATATTGCEIGKRLRAHLLAAGLRSSVGLLAVDGTAIPPDRAVRLADREMYVAKAAGTGLSLRVVDGAAAAGPELPQWGESPAAERNTSLGRKR